MHLRSMNASIHMPSSAQIYWITGLPAAGKTSLAQALVRALHDSGRLAFALDGDDLRKGLCSDLGHSTADRSENIRRAGEVARLMANAGFTVVCAFVSPFTTDRQRVRTLFEPSQFVEIFLNTSVQECARRDPKGLYAQAKAGRITGLTGWDGPYERPTNPEYEFDTEKLSTDQMVHLLLGR